MINLKIAMSMSEAGQIKPKLKVNLLPLRPVEALNMYTYKK